MEKIVSVKSTKKILYINLIVTFLCNLDCHYCIAGEKNEKTLSKEKIDEFIKFIGNIENLNKYESIEITLTGGEPFLNKNIDYLIEKIFLLNSNKIKLSILTNGILLFSKIDFFVKNNGNKKLDFTISHHYNEIVKENNEQNLLKSLKILKENNMNFSLNFLIPDDVLFYIYKNYLDGFFLKTNDILDKNIEYTLLRYNNFLSSNYSKKHLEFYEKNSKIYDNKDEIINIRYSDNKEIKRNLDIDFFYVNKLNDFKYWECYPNTGITHLNITPDFKISLGTCNTLRNKIFSPGEIIKMLQNVKYKVICNDDFCDCSDILFDKNYSKKHKILFDKINEILKNNILRILPSWMSGNKKIEYKNDGEIFGKIIIKIEYEDDFILNIIFEKYDKNRKYAFSNDKVGTYNYVENNYRKGKININIEKKYYIFFEKNFKIFSDLLFKIDSLFENNNFSND